MSYASAAWGSAGGGLSIVAGVSAQSTALIGTGADVLADLASTVFLIWRFRVERRGHPAPHEVERRAQLVASTCLLVVAVGLAVTAGLRLASGQGAHPSAFPITLAAASIVVLPTLSWWKYRVAASVPSRALHTDAHIGVIGAMTAALTLIGLVITSALGWTAADPIAALAVAAIAAWTGGRALTSAEP